MNNIGTVELANALLAATARRRPIPPIRRTHPEMTVDDAYAIQLGQLQHLRATGRSLVGRKIGLTSRAMQEQLGIASPDFGYVLDDMVYSDGDVVPAGRFIAPRVEPELAFVLRAPLEGYRAPVETLQ